MTKAIAEGKAKVTVADVDWLIRLEEFLREEGKAGQQTMVVLEWHGPGDSDDEQDKEGGGPHGEGE